MASYFVVSKIERESKQRIAVGNQFILKNVHQIEIERSRERNILKAVGFGETQEIASKIQKKFVVLLDIRDARF